MSAGPGGLEIFGRVIRGEGYGRVLGFPTANLERRSWLRLRRRPRRGVWAALVDLDGHRYWAAVVIGPKDALGITRVEAHLLDFSGDLYGRILALRLLRYLRPYRKFSNPEALISRINRDVAAVRRLAAMTGEEGL